MQLIDEVSACGGVFVDFVQRGTEEFDRVDGLYLSGAGQPARCIACNRHPDVPIAFVCIHAREGESVTLPIPICEACGSAKGKVHKAAQKILEELFPDAQAEFRTLVES